MRTENAELHFSETTESDISMSSLGLVDHGGSVWPRRASRACASCRRDKIRCDGARPCGACMKRGFSTNQCTDGCEPCRRARARCEDSISKPCRRCSEMRVECTDGTTIAVPPRTASPPVPTRIPRGSDRAKAACSSCRRDNKKCDDQRPCSRCIARSEECIHVTRGPKLVKLRCEGCRADNKRCEESRPCRYCVENEKECIIVPRKGRGHGTRVKSACMSCRRDKIRCNGERPCASCVKKGCDCIERACTACTRDGRPAECTHRRPVDGGWSDTGGDPISQADIRTTPLKDFRFVPSQEYSKWPSFGLEHRIQSMPSISPPIYPSQQLPLGPPPGCYYYPQQQIQQASTSIMQNQVSVYSHNMLHSAYFFDPNLDSYPISQHMASSSRTFLPDD